MCDKDGNCKAVTDLFDDRRNHQRTEAQRVFGDEYKRDLPGQPNADKPIEKRRTRDWRRVSAADQIEHEIERRKDEDAQIAAIQKMILANLIDSQRRESNQLFQ